MTSNPYLKRLIGEAVPEEAEAAVEQDTPEELIPPADAGQEAVSPPDAAPSQPDATTLNNTAPSVQELAQAWQSGERMGVAARLMFTEASYADFVDLIFTLGHESGRELGHLLDELADTEGIEPPQTPPQYRSALQHVASGEEEGVL